MQKGLDRLWSRRHFLYALGALPVIGAFAEARLASPSRDITLFLCGDVMTGRGIDQAMPHSVDHQIFESYMKSALAYLRLAEHRNGRILHPISYDYPWGDALPLLKREAPDLRLINLETAVTARGKPEPKGINYRMHPLNIPCLAALGVSGAVLANNHVLDWGEQGLEDTLNTLQKAGISSVGAGRNLREAQQEAVWAIPDKARLRLFAYGHVSSGVPATWAASDDRAGVNWLPNLSDNSVKTLAAHLRETKKDGDIIVVSLHWGSNWGYEVPAAKIRFAHALIDEASVDLVWGHSSHHPRPIEVHHGRLILYGAGDFYNDYEGIEGYEEFRADLVALYLVHLNTDGSLRELRLWPLRIHRFRLQRATAEEGRWMAETLSQVGQAYGTRLEVQPDGSLLLGIR